MYDVILVGGGPTALTLATYLPGKIALLERHPVLGGCHRVLPAAQFTEHGPRVYSGAYTNVAAVLRRIGVAWNDVFAPTPFSPEKIDGKVWYQWLSPKEIAWLSYEYIIFALFNPVHGQGISMKTYCARKGFSAESLAYIDTVCRFSDGAGADRYSLWEFVSGFDQHITPFHVPKAPLDGLFRTWQAYLERKGVDIFLNADVKRVTPTSVTSGKIFRAKKVVLCIPPTHADALLRKSGITEPGFKDFAKKTKYDPYWSVTFFGVSVDNAEGHASTPWGCLAVQYPFGVVSAAATRWNVESPVTGKTLSKTIKTDEAAREIARQLGFSTETKYAFPTSKYHDQAFMATANRGYFKSELNCGIASVGCHNGKSSYNFTSMESAVQNALAYIHEPAVGAWHASDAVRWGLVVCIVITSWSTASAR